MSWKELSLRYLKKLRCLFTCKNTIFHLIFYYYSTQTFVCSQMIFLGFSNSSMGCTRSIINNYMYDRTCRRLCTRHFLKILLHAQYQQYPYGQGWTLFPWVPENEFQQTDNGTVQWPRARSNSGLLAFPIRLLFTLTLRKCYWQNHIILEHWKERTKFWIFTALESLEDKNTIVVIHRIYLLDSLNPGHFIW